MSSLRKHYRRSPDKEESNKGDWRDNISKRKRKREDDDMDQDRDVRKYARGERSERRRSGWRKSDVEEDGRSDKRSGSRTRRSPSRGGRSRSRDKRSKVRRSRSRDKRSRSRDKRERGKRDRISRSRDRRSRDDGYDDKRKSRSFGSGTKYEKIKSHKEKDMDKKNVISEEEMKWMDMGLNQLAARMIKADLMGDNKTSKLFSERLEKARLLTDPANFEKQEDGSVVLLNLDGASAVKYSVAETADSDDIRILAAREKLTRKNDEILYDLRKENEMDADFDQEFDDFAVYNKKKKKKGKKGKKSSQRIAIDEYLKEKQNATECMYCYDNDNIPNQLKISLGIHAYVMLPFHKLVDGHCMIVPTEHECSGSRNVDDEVYEEIKKYMECICKMNYALGKGTIFMETFLKSKKGVHSHIDCIPLEPKYCNEAQYFFKKALQDSGPRWSSNPRLIMTSEKGLRRSIPTNFPYFHVQLGTTIGMAHTIENPSKFSPKFGFEVIGGILKMDPEKYLSLQDRPSLQQEQQYQLAFLAAWDPYDWTHEL
eukprot:TRINITY_DN3446_c0_g1_i1.p1 TRINITY_DN3446_c0_g1~~TRINITY_DN3446_c0_g1_i1.p1  ORF type:complete len:541 (-),score=116.33 TRINITY_DN3446_c0_g1_i1:59-1681(-)